MVESVAWSNSGTMDTYVNEEYEYTLDGFQTKKINHINGTSTEYVYDDAGQLTYKLRVCWLD